MSKLAQSGWEVALKVAVGDMDMLLGRIGMTLLGRGPAPLALIVRRCEHEKEGSYQTAVRRGRADAELTLMLVRTTELNIADTQLTSG